MRKIFGLLLLFLSFASSASAHTTLVSAIPSEGAIVASMPSEVRLKFDEKLLVIGGKDASSLVVKDGTGKIVSGEGKSEGESIYVPITSPADATGNFEVAYRVAGADGHVVEGSYQFQVGGGVVASPSVISTHSDDAKEDGSNLLVRVFIGLCFCGGLFIVLRRVKP